MKTVSLVQGWEINLARGHIEKVILSRGPYLPSV